LNAQGEDVVAGTRTPNPISQLKKELPKVYEEFNAITQLLEKHYHDMQDCEFTIERGKLWMLQTRTGKRTGAAAVRIAVDMASEKLIDRATAVQRVTPEHLDQLLHPTVDPKTDARVLATGLPASPGAAQDRWSFLLTKLKRWRKTARRSCWSVPKPVPTIFTAWSRPRPSSPPVAA
jgi:pyruvate,orthophosphate dikinase